MNFKFSCCILLSLVISVVYSKPMAATGKKTKSDEKELAHAPKKRISTQTKPGAGHAKGPMAATNGQANMPLPVIVPFPMIPFDNRFPIIMPPNGKQKKGKGGKKDPKNETEDEHDKDVDDEKDDGKDQYKGQGGKSGGKGTTKEDKIKKIEHRQHNNKDPKVKDKSSPSRKYKQEGNEQEEENTDQGREDVQSSEEEEDDQEKESKHSNTREILRQRRSAFTPIIGNPEDIMPYLMFDSGAEETTDLTDEHVIKTRSVDDEEEVAYVPETENNDDADEEHVINVRDVGDDDEVPHVVDTRDVIEDEEDTPRDMRTRSVPDGRSHEHVTYQTNVEFTRTNPYFSE